MFGVPLASVDIEQTACMAMGAAADIYVLSRGKARFTTQAAVGAGPLTSHVPRATPTPPVEMEGVFDAVSGMPLVGNADGIIQAFGVYLTRHYANYYNRVSFEFLHRLVARFGDEGFAVAANLLVEAGHVCAFHTFGGIMQSTEWDALIRPSLKTPEDWVIGMVAVINALGWGRWQVTEVSRGEATFVLHDDYESVGYLAMYGKSSKPVSFLAEGGVLGVMNLVYEGNIAQRPALTPAYYDALFKRSCRYRGQVLTSRAMGDEVSSFHVYRS